MERTTFSTSRLLEFFTAKELRMQTGYGQNEWPIALLKELLDNALDACETADIKPVIHVVLENDSVSVQDNGPGLPFETLKKSLDYTIRVSDKLHYVSPTRGQLGNALKCVWAAPFVAGGNEHGRVDVIANGKQHTIDVRLDRIAQEPKIDLETSPSDSVKTGTFIKIHWPEIAGSLTPPKSAYFYSPLLTASQLVTRYAMFNPHATFGFDGVGTLEATDREWSHWSPSNPTSPHWYIDREFLDLISAYIAEERNGGEVKTIRQFVGEFKGLSGTRKQKMVAEAVQGEYLHDLVNGEGVDYGASCDLLWEMQGAARRVSPQSLGVIGEAHFQRILEGTGSDGITYAKKTGYVRNVPYVLEVGFGVDKHDRGTLETIVGLNWAPALKGNVFGMTLSRVLTDCHVDDHDPVNVIIHLAYPKLEFEDRGKSTLTLPREIEDDLIKAIKKATKDWTAYKKQLRREQRAERREWEKKQEAKKRKRLNIKEAAFAVMADAYLKVSAGDKLPARPRQMMYACRPGIIELAGKCWKNSSYFTQRVLPEYLEMYPKQTKDWNIVYDARGHIREPYTNIEIDLGTLEVRNYIDSWETELKVGKPQLGHRVQTVGPVNRFKFVLFVEKEGFYPLFRAAELEKKWGIAIMSTKGMSVTAARELVEELSLQGVTCLVLRDFDKAGFSIVHTLSHDTDRYQFDARPDVIDLGLRLKDVEAMDLESEPVTYDTDKDPKINLYRNGATDAEAEFLVRRGRPGYWVGERVELNAMTSSQMIAWLEEKFEKAGVEKVIPQEEVLKKAYVRAKRIEAMQAAIDKAWDEFDDGDIEIPDNLGTQIERAIAGTNDSWDNGVWKVAIDDH